MKSFLHSLIGWQQAMPWRFNFLPSIDQLKDLVKGVTPGPWESNCASEIFATIDGESIRIGHFQGCAADAKAVVDLINAVRGFNSSGQIDATQPVSADEA